MNSDAVAAATGSVSAASASNACDDAVGAAAATGSVATATSLNTFFDNCRH